MTALLAAAGLLGCEAGAGAASEPLENVGQALVREPLTEGGFIDWDLFRETSGSRRPGLDWRFEEFRHFNAVDVKVQAPGDAQRILFRRKFQAAGNGGVALTAREYRLRGGEYFKGWLRGTVNDSANVGSGHCGDDDPLVEPVRAQLQFAFLSETGAARGICYCNVCPASGGESVTCKTDQWALNGLEVSDDGACRAPADARRVRVTLEAIGKDPAALAPPIRALVGQGVYGTVVFNRFRFGRCADGGGCSNIDPDWYTQ